MSSVVDNYDYIIFDCPPALSVTTSAAALCADRIILPVTPMKFSLQGLNASYTELEQLEDKFGKSNLKKSIIFNRFDARKTSSTEYLKQLVASDTYSKILMNSFIRENSELENSINQKQSIFDSNRKSNAKEDLDLFTREIMNLDSKELFKQ